MARTIKQKRAVFMDTLINKIFNNLDPSGVNSKKYNDMLSKMSDDEFDKWVRKEFAEEDYTLYWEFIEFEREAKIENIAKASKATGIPLYEYVCVPYLNGDPDNVVVTPEPVPVGKILMKRMPQTIHHKNAGSTSIDVRNSKNGQVTGADKNGRNTNVETYNLIVYGAYKSLKEFLGPRADNEVEKNQMYAKIERDGYVYSTDLHSSKDDRTAQNTLAVYYESAGLVTNLINGGGLIQSPRNKDTKTYTSY